MELRFGGLIAPSGAFGSGAILHMKNLILNRNLRGASSETLPAGMAASKAPAPKRAAARTPSPRRHTPPRANYRSPPARICLLPTAPIQITFTSLCRAARRSLARPMRRLKCPGSVGGSNTAGKSARRVTRRLSPCLVWFDQPGRIRPFAGALRGDRPGCSPTELHHRIFA